MEVFVEIWEIFRYKTVNLKKFTLKLSLLQELEDENKTNDIVDRLSSLVLNDIISSYTETFTPPPPPYVSTKVSGYVGFHWSRYLNLTCIFVTLWTTKTDTVALL